MKHNFRKLNVSLKIQQHGFLPEVACVSLQADSI